MTRDQGNRILDQIKAGEADYSVKAIRLALIATGDPSDNPAPPLPCSGREEGWQPGVRYAQAHRNTHQPAEEAHP